MYVSRQSVDKLLRAMQKDLLKQKEIIEKELDALTIVIRMNESRTEGKNSRRQSGYMYEIIEAMHQLLSEESPLHRDEITKRVKQRGLHIGGGNHVATIGTLLSRDARFTNVSRGTWMLTQDKQPETKKDPSENGQEKIDLAAIGIIGE